jgi:MFS family permease
MKNSINKDITILGFSRVTRSVAAGMINIAFPYYILTQLHYGAFVMGLIYVSATVATAVLGFLSGITTDVWGKRGTLIIASALLPVSSIMIYFSSSLWVIVPAAMVGGYSATGSLAGGGIGGAVQPIQSAVLAGLAPNEKRTKLFSFFTFLSGVTGALGALLSKAFDVREIFLAATIISALGIPELWYLKVAEAKGKIGRLKTGSTIGKFTLTGMLNGLSQGLIVPFLIPFFVLVYHLPKSQMSEYAFASGLLGSFAILGAPLLEKYFGFVKSIVFTRGLGTILFVIFPVIRLLPLSVFIYIIGPALRVAALPIQQSELTKRVDDDEMGRALGINQVARLAASSTGTGLSGYLMDTALFELPFFIYGAIMVGNLYLYIRFFGKKRIGAEVDVSDGAEIK